MAAPPSCQAPPYCLTRGTRRMLTIFWGPMAYAMMGGIIVGTMLTLLFLPALYVAWFRIKEPGSAADDQHIEAHVCELQAGLPAEAHVARETEAA